jgi:phage shock protein PspC (stress-responsive transcriptional regulator)
MSVSSKKSKPKKLTRSKNNAFIAGVCAGLGEFFNLDPTLVRIIFVLFTLLGGSGVLLYIILWLIIPSK